MTLLRCSCQAGKLTLFISHLALAASFATKNKENNNDHSGPLLCSRSTHVVERGMVDSTHTTGRRKGNLATRRAQYNLLCDPSLSTRAKRCFIYLKPSQGGCSVQEGCHFLPIMPSDRDE